MKPKQGREAVNVQKFAARLKTLREQVELGQSELAEKANISPAALSRLLSGERDLKPAQARSLATVLGVTVMELLVNTEYADVFEGWVQIEDLQSAEARIQEQAAKIESLNRQLDGSKAESASLVSQITALLERVNQLEQDNAVIKGQIQNHDAVVAELNRVRQENITLTTERDRLKSSLNALQLSDAKKGQQLKQYALAFNHVQAKLNRLQADLSSAHSSIAPTAILSALAGFGLAALLSENDK